MATIQTYDARPVTKTAEEETGFSTTGAVLSGVSNLVKPAATIALAVNEAKRKEDENNLWASSANTMESLNNANAEILEKYKNNPNINAMNQELDAKFKEIVSNTQPGLAQQSLDEYNKVALSAYTKMRNSNANWAAKRASVLAKQNESKVAVAGRKLNAGEAYQAGFQGADYTIPGGQFMLRIGGEKTLADGTVIDPTKATEFGTNMPLLGLSSSEKTMVRESVAANYMGAIDGMPGVDLSTVEGTIVTGKNEDGTDIEVPVSQYLSEKESGVAQLLLKGEITEKEAKKVLAKLNEDISSKNDNVYSKSDIISRKVDEYYDKLIGRINNDNILTDSTKKDLVNRAENARENNKKEFIDQEVFNSAMIALQASNTPSYESMEQQITDTIRGESYLSAWDSSWDEAAESAGGAFQLNETMSNSFSIADRNPYSAFNLAMTKPGGWSDSMMAFLKETPSGEWTIEELQKKYAPNGTAQEMSMLGNLIQMSPNLVVDWGDQWKNESQGGTFDETDWAYDTLQQILSMPEQNNKQRAAKTFAITNAIVQGRKNANNGQGILDPDLKETFEYILLGNSFSGKGWIAHAGIGRTMKEMVARADAITKDMFANATVNTNLQPIRQAAYKTDMMKSIMNTALANARRTLYETGDVNAAQRILEQGRFDMLCEKWSDYMDLRKMEQDKAAGRQPIFTYNGTPYIYEGNQGGEIYVRVGDRQFGLKGDI